MMNTESSPIPRAGLKLTATMPDGTKETRTTARVYTHVVVVWDTLRPSDIEPRWSVMSWHGTEYHATTARVRYQRQYATGFKVMPVEMDENWCRLAEAQQARDARRRTLSMHERAVCGTCGRAVELLGTYGNGRPRWAHVGKPRGRAHVVTPREGPSDLAATR
jgi:hypothetical protein